MKSHVSLLSMDNLARQECLNFAIANADRHLAQGEAQIRAQRGRIAALEQLGVDAADARDFLAALEDCQRSHEVLRLHLVRERDQAGPK
jgi:hypothetical protein